jgi:DNA-directed RNA polymerase specialized sigma24 family protein
VRDGNDTQPPATDYRAIADGLRSSDDRVARRSLTELVCQLHPKLAAWLGQRGVQDDDIKDFLQQTWLNVWQSRANIDPAKFCKAWVFRICHNVLNDAKREKMKQQEVGLTDAHRDSLVTDDRDEPPDSQVSQTDRRRVRQGVILEEMSRWSEEDQTILWTWANAEREGWTDGLTQKTGKNPATLRKRLFDLKERLGRAAAQLDDGDGFVGSLAPLIVHHLPPSDTTASANNVAGGRGDNRG